MESTLVATSLATLRIATLFGGLAAAEPVEAILLDEEIPFYPANIPTPSLSVPVLALHGRPSASEEGRYDLILRLGLDTVHTISFVAPLALSPVDARLLFVPSHAVPVPTGTRAIRTTDAYDPAQR